MVYNINMNKGDRVIAIAASDHKDSIIGQAGTIIYVGLGGRVLVEFDNNICGHNGNGLGKPRRCWMVHTDKLKIYNKGEKKMGPCQDAETRPVNRRGLFEVYAIHLETEEIVFEQKIVAESEQEALLWSNFKEALKEKKLSKNDLHLIVREIGEVPERQKPQAVKLLDKICNLLPGPKS